MFPAIRGVQAGHEYYVTMCPLRIIPRLFLFNEEELPPEMRAQRSLNKNRVPEMARYIVENPDSYIFSALTASVNAEVRFESLAGGSGADRTRRHADDPDVGDVRDQRRTAPSSRHPAGTGREPGARRRDHRHRHVHRRRARSVPADVRRLNRYAIRRRRRSGCSTTTVTRWPSSPDRSSSSTPFLRDVTDMENSSLAQRSRKLFTLSSFHTANASLLEGIKEDAMADRVELASSYWQRLPSSSRSGSRSTAGRSRAGEVRRDFIHTHSIVLHALGRVGNALLRKSEDPKQLGPGRSRSSATIDWHRTNAEVWEGRATSGGNVSKSRRNVELTTAYIRTVLGMPLPPDEQRAEEAFVRGEKK